MAEKTEIQWTNATWNVITVASQFAPVVIDVYGELIHEAPQAFDPTAVALRAIT